MLAFTKMAFWRISGMNTNALPTVANKLQQKKVRFFSELKQLEALYS